MKKFIYLASFLLLSLLSFGQSTVTVNGNVQLATGAVCAGGTGGTNCFVRIRLRNYQGYVPRVVGTGALVATQPPDIIPNGSGVWSTTLWGNDNIQPNTCNPGGNQACTFYTFEFWYGGKMISSANWQFIGAGPFNLNSLAPMTSPAPTPPPFLPVLLNPSGDQTINSFKLILPGGLKLSSITGLAQCLHVDTTGLVSGTGSDCGAGGGGGPTLQTNGVNNTFQNILNLTNSTSNTNGLALSVSNPAGGQDKFEVTVSNQQTALNSISPTPTRAGDLISWNGFNWVDFAGNNSGTKILQEDSSGNLSWVSQFSGVTGSGTTNTLPIWSSSTALGNSLLSQFALGAPSSGTLVQIGSSPVNSSNLFSVNAASSNTCVFGATFTIPMSAQFPCYDTYINSAPTSTNAQSTTVGLQISSLASSHFSAGINIYAQGNASGVAEIRGIESDVVSGGGGSSSALRSGLFYSDNNSNITNATQQGIYIITGTGNAASVTTNNYGIFVDSPFFTGASTLTHNYGIFVADQSVTGGSGVNSDPHAIVTAGTSPSQFGGLVNHVSGIQQNGTALGMNCGTTSTCANTSTPLVRFVFGSAPLVSASPSTVTITGISPAFTSSSSYFCVNGNYSSSAHVEVQFTNVSGSSFTITGPNTTTDVISYMCIGT